MCSFAVSTPDLFWHSSNSAELFFRRLEDSVLTCKQGLLSVKLSEFAATTSYSHRRAGVPADLDPPRFGPPRSISASRLGPPGPNLLADLDPSPLPPSLVIDSIGLQDEMETLVYRWVSNQYHIAFKVILGVMEEVQLLPNLNERSNVHESLLCEGECDCCIS